MRSPRLLALALLAVACVPSRIRHARKLEGQYATGLPAPSVWIRVDPGGADRAWYCGQLGAVIYTDSNCGVRFLDGRPDQLVDHLLWGFDEPVEISRETHTVDGRDAVMSVRSGRLDGIDVQVGVVVLKKSACTYDLVYLAPPQNFEAGWPAFQAVIDGFDAEEAGLE